MDVDVAADQMDAASAARARKTAVATAAAAAARVQLAQEAKGPFSEMHSSMQVLLLGDEELWDTIAEQWCKPGAEKISGIVDTWEGRDLAACVHRLGLPVLYAKKNYVPHMRRSVVQAVRAHALAHPELFDAEPASAGAAESDAEEPEPEAEQKAEQQAEQKAKQKAATVVKVATPPRAAAAALPAAQLHRRSPRATASSRSVAAMAIAALQPLQPVGSPAASASARRSPADCRSKRSAPAPLCLQEAGAGDFDPSSGSEDARSEEDSDWSPRADPLDAAMRHGGRLSRDETERQLARAGVPRSFAKGFVANAQFSAGGRSMYQLYKEVTSAPAFIKNEPAKHECLALARILDALLRGDKSAALELTCRRLGGVQTAAETGNWAMCERLETEAQQRSFVPDEFMRAALKSVVQTQAVRKSAADGAASFRGASSRGASASGRYSGSAARPNKKESQKDTKDPGAGSSRKKKGGSDTQ